MKTSRQSLDRLKPYAVFRDSWDTALNNALDMLDDLKSDSDKESHTNPFEEEVKAEKSDLEKLLEQHKD